MISFVDEINFCNKRVVVRVDYNVPMNNDNRVSDTRKIRASIPTINKILNDGGSVVLISHFGRPSGPVDNLSLSKIKEYLEAELGFEVGFYNLFDDPKKSTGKVVLLENLRFYKEEISLDLDFAKKIAGWGDAFVNDAFGTVHRNHTSTVILPKLFQIKAGGLLLKDEIYHANEILEDSSKPFTIVLGGIKVLDKLKPIRRFLPLFDNLLLGGGVSIAFAKSLGYMDDLNTDVNDDDDELSNEVLCILDYLKSKGREDDIILPIDLVTLTSSSSNEGLEWPGVNDWFGIEDNEMIVDVGPKTCDRYCDILKKSKKILWTGPLGYVEKETFKKGSLEILDAISIAVKNGAKSLIGGGETSSLIDDFDGGKYGYVSTGGSALVHYLGNKNLKSIFLLGE